MSADIEATEPVTPPTEADQVNTQVTPEATSTEAPTSESPASDTPASEAPSGEAPTGEAPSGEAPANEPSDQVASEVAVVESPSEASAAASQPEATSSEAPATEVAATEAPATEAPATEVAATEVPAPEVAAEVSAAAATPVASETTTEAAPSEPAVQESAPAPEAVPKPSERIQVGSQREDESAAELKPVGTEAPSQVPEEPGPSDIPAPNVREALPPELEQELEAALGGQSLDQIIESTPGAEVSGEELAPDTRLQGKVVKIHREDVFLDLGGRNQGLLPLKQFEKTEPPALESELEIVVSRFNSEQGLYEVSLPSAAVSVGNWDEVEVGQIVDVTITGSNKGGLECQVSNIRGFIPMGQISIFRVEKPEEFVNQKLTCVITEANRDRKNLVLSHRAIMERERKEKREKLINELAPGQIMEGVVRNLRDFGAFVDLGGVDGLIHVSQLSWERVKHPSDVLQVGQTVKVRIEKVDKETGKIGLAYRDLAENPWKQAASTYAVGSTVSGKVSKLMQFGAFVRLEAGVEGLIHISEMGHGRVKSASDVVSSGQDVEVKVLSVDVDAQRIALSLKALMPKPEKPKAPEPPPPDPAEIAAAEEAKRKREEKAKHLKGGISAPSGGEKFGLKW